jgi:hypothetical protein
MRRVNLVGLILTAAFAFSTANSEAAYKCVDANGKTNFQDKKCPTTSTESEMSLKKQSKTESPQSDQSWSKDRRQVLNLMCIRGLGQLGQEQGPSSEIGRKICECTAKKYYENPKSVIDQIEKSGDAEKAKKLMEPAMISCTQEVWKSRP